MNGGAGRGTRAPTTKPQSTAANRGALVPGSSRGRGGGGGGGGEVSEVGGVRPRQRMTVVPAGSRSVGTAPTYGEIVDSDEVHDEIRDLGNQVKQVIKDHFQRHGTSEEQVLGGIRQFGPSKQSKKILNKENEAAKLAFETGIYAVWRAMEAPKLSGGNQDFCCRIGYRHRCFCGHTLAAHRTPPTPTPGKKMKLPQKYPCEESGCACASFQYVPNEPEEIGEGWLTRRSNWDPAKWSAKCRCGHGHKEHEPAHQRCKSCGCGRFNSHFLCVVCDLPWESHETVFETEAERHRAGFPVREDYFPLSGIDWDVRELVLTDATGGGALQAPSAGSRITGRGANPRVIECSPADEAFAPGNYCRGCATVFRDASSKVCAKCGKAR